jgi:hypothetical protein
MFESPLALILVLLAASVFVVTLARRLGLPAILGYVTVGLTLGPHASGLFPESDASHLMAELRWCSCCSRWAWSFPGRAWSRCGARYSAWAACRSSAPPQWWQ